MVIATVSVPESTKKIYKGKYMSSPKQEIRQNLLRSVIINIETKHSSLKLLKLNKF